MIDIHQNDVSVKQVSLPETVGMLEKFLSGLAENVQNMQKNTYRDEKSGPTAPPAVYLY